MPPCSLLYQAPSRFRGNTLVYASASTSSCGERSRWVGFILSPARDVEDVPEVHVKLLLAEAGLVTGGNAAPAGGPETSSRSGPSGSDPHGCLLCLPPRPPPSPRLLSHLTLVSNCCDRQVRSAARRRDPGLTSVGHGLLLYVGGHVQIEELA